MNFTVDELCRSKTAQRRGIDNTPTPSIRVNLEKLIANVLQPLRDKYGKPIIVDSGYRCPKLNQAVGGAKTSQHLYGQAVDIHSVSDSVKDNKELFDLAKQMIENKEIIVGQLINEYNYNWIHISIPDGNIKTKFQQ